MLKMVTPRSGRPTQAQLEERKARVLRVAEDLFLSRGFAETTVAEIARRSQVSPRLITGHFGDKAEIFSEIIMQANSRALDESDLPGHADTLESFLFGAAKFAWKVAYAPHAISFLRTVVGEGGRFGEVTAVIAKRASDDFFQKMEGIFAHLIARGMILPDDPARLAKYFVDLVVGFSLVQAGMGYWDRVSDDAELRDKIAFFCHGLKLPS